jgi:regulatory protein
VKKTRRTSRRTGKEDGLPTGTEVEPRAGEKDEPRAGEVTGTSVQVRDSNRISIFVDGEFSFGMPVAAAMDLGIIRGCQIDEALLARCLGADEAYRARQRALGLLAHRSRSTAELRKRLKLAGFGMAAIDHAVARVTDLGYLDDAAFAESFARSRILTRRLGTRRVLAELGAKGISRPEAERVVSRLDADRDELADARLHATRHASRMGPVTDSRKKRRRLYAYLARRGFASDTIRRVLEEILRTS